MFVAEFFSPDTEYAAFGERTRATAEGLGMAGFDIRVLVLRRSPNDGPPFSSSSYVFEPMPKTASFFLRRNLAANAIQRILIFFEVLITVLKHRPELLVVSAHDPIFCMETSIIATIFATPFVIDAHDSRLVLAAEQSKEMGKGFKRALESSAMQRASRIWVPTQRMALMLTEEYDIPNRKFTVVANGVDSSRFARVQNQTRGPHTILHLGGPRAYYDSATLVKAFRIVLAQVPDATLVFLGIRDDSYTRNVMRLCEELKVQEAIQFLPPAPPDLVPVFMSRAALGVHTYALNPVYATTVGLKVAEYMAAGLPILHRGPSGGETWKLIERCGAGRCAESVEGLAHHAIELLSDPELRQSIGDQGRRMASTLDWKTTLEVAIQDAYFLTRHE